MNVLNRWNPWKELDEIQRRLMSGMDGVSARRSPIGREQENVTVPEWTPAVDIIEDEKEYLIKVELPEVQKDAVKVVVEGGTLTISGERQAEKEEKNRKVHRVERYYGRFVRSFSIPDDAEDGEVRAEFKDGVLNVHLAKSEKARPRHVEVQVS